MRDKLRWFNPWLFVCWLYIENDVIKSRGTTYLWRAWCLAITLNVANFLIKLTGAPQDKGYFCIVDL
jgi:hypothetical protein